MIPPKKYPEGTYQWICGADIYPIPYPSDIPGECEATGTVEFDPESGDDEPAVLCTRCGSELSATFDHFELIPPEELTPLETRIKEFRAQIPVFAEGGRASALRGVGEEFGEMAEAAVVGTDEEFWSECADVCFTIMGLMAAEGKSLTAWVEKKVTRAEGRVDQIIEKQRARRRGSD